MAIIRKVFEDLYINSKTINALLKLDKFRLKVFNKLLFN